MAQSPEYPDLTWVPPASYSPGRPEGPPRFIVVHYTAGHEGPHDAENGAAYDQDRDDGTSTHYHVDSDSVVQCVRTTDRAHTAFWHGNMWGIQYELAGTLQTREQWLDTTSRATIRNCARQAARDMVKWGIPLVRVVGRGVRDPNARGVCGHVDMTVGWPEDGGDHTDPGPEFPWDVLFADIAEAMGGGQLNGEDDMTLFVVQVKGDSRRYLGNTLTRRAIIDDADLANIRHQAKEKLLNVFHDGEIIPLNTAAQLNEWGVLMPFAEATNPPTAATSVEIDYELLAGKVADLLAARLKS